MDVITEKTIKIETKPFGEMEVKEKNILNFPHGMYGFEDYSKFIILEPRKKNTILYWLQSLDDSSLTFILTKPTFFIPTYQPVLDPDSFSVIGLPKIENVNIWSIVTIPAGNPNQMTLNLQGPVIINPQNSLGAQFISMDDQHRTKVAVLDLVNMNKKESLQMQNEKKISSI